MYSSKITYPILELNSSFFLETLRKVLEVELLKQRTDFGKTFLPQIVKKDDYLLNPILDSDMNPSFCAIIKAKTLDDKSGAKQQQNTNTAYMIVVAAYGLTVLREIQDVIFQILNDLNVKHYFQQLQREVVSGEIYPYNLIEYQVLGGESIIYNGDTINAGDKFIAVDGVAIFSKTTGNEIVIQFDNKIIFDDDTYVVNSVNTDINKEKTVNDLNFISGNLQIDVIISENTKLNKTDPITVINTEHKVGENNIKIEQQTNF